LRRFNQAISKLILLLSSASPIVSQILNRHAPVVSQCDPVEIRLAAKQRDGSPFTTLTTSDIHFTFADGPSEVSLLRSFEVEKGANGFTDILFVIPPMADFNSPQDLSGIVQTLAKNDAFRFRAAVLGPSGALSSFTSDLETLRIQLHSATTQKGVHSLDRWVRAEETAFLALRRLEGRHAIVRLFHEENPHHFRMKTMSANDYALDTFASLDIAEIYRLLQTVPLSSAIPMGDASSENSPPGVDPNLSQLSQVQSASEQQSAIWASRGRWDELTAGRAEDSTKTLMEDLIRDNRSTYHLIVQPEFPCGDARFRLISITTQLANVRLFAPHEIQMIPYRPLPSD
jgi:hypothetical protein